VRVRRSIAVAAALLFSIASFAVEPDVAQPDWVLSCDGTSRWFPPHADLAFLQKTFGPENVQVATVDAGEGDMQPGAIIFPKQPEHHIEVLWKHGKDIAGIEMVTISGEHSDWHTCEGVTLGTDLKRLELLNGKPFSMSGLGWDYSGGVGEWRGGKLAKSFNHIFVFMDGTGATNTYDQVAGDKNFLSSFPAMQQVNPTVYKMGVSYLSDSH